MGLVPPAKALLERITGATVTDLNAGCCGMAGSFGYVRGQYEVSKTIGERKLLPAARAQSADTVLVASGVSCRHQIADFTDVSGGTSGRTSLAAAAAGPTMNLAVISVAALALAVLVSCVTSLNVGVLAIALAWIIGVYIGGMPLNTVIGRLPDASCSSR